MDLLETRDVPETAASGDVPCWPSLLSWPRESVSCLVFLQLEQSYADLAQISHKKLTPREHKLNLESFIPKAEFVVKLWVTEMWGAGAVGVGRMAVVLQRLRLHFLPWMLNYSRMCHTPHDPWPKASLPCSPAEKKIRTVTNKAASHGKKRLLDQVFSLRSLKMTIHFFPTSQTLSADAHMWIPLKSKRLQTHLKSLLGGKKAEV